MPKIANSKNSSKSVHVLYVGQKATLTVSNVHLLREFSTPSGGGYNPQLSYKRERDRERERESLFAKYQ